jgi:hypothetical protein
VPTSHAAVPAHPTRLQAELPAHGQQLEFDFCVPPSLSSASPTDAAVGTGPIDEQSFAAFRSEIAGPRARARTSAACGSRAAAFSCLDTLQPYGITRSLIAINPKPYLDNLKPYCDNPKPYLDII